MSAGPTTRFDETTVDDNFTASVREMQPPARPLERLSASLSPEQAIELFESQVYSRQLDFVALSLRKRGAGFYTIGSCGHEGNAAVAEAMRPTDPALLHYRSGAFFVHRAKQMGYANAVLDVLLGMTASRDEPIAGGRHKVFGNAQLHIPPQTSTIGSHLPKAVGMAFHLKRAARLGLTSGVPGDAVIMCSFGDASANHSTATGAINASCYIAHQGLPLPVLFVCEDNGLGISVKTAPGWIAQNFRAKPGLEYFAVDGCDLLAATEVAREAVDYVRSSRRPAFLHLSVVRPLGHAGSDVALAYRTVDELRADLARDPLVASARVLVEAGMQTPDQILERYDSIRAEVLELADEAARRPRLKSAEEVMAFIAPRRPDAIATEVAREVDQDARRAFWGRALPEQAGPLPLSGHINRCLGDLLVKYPELLLFGEDVARKGGVYGVTRGLLKRAGIARVYDTLLDEQTIFGLAIGAAQAGCIPIPEIQYLAYLHTAEDQLRGEAATLQFFSQAQFRNPMVVRVAGYAYQEGFGGHFHNDNSVAVFRDIPGLIVASPSCGSDAAAMMRTCVAAARVDGAISAFIEPIALYHTRDLHETGDGAYESPYDPVGENVSIGSARVWGDPGELLIVSFANGVRMSRRVAKRLADRHGIVARVLDLRWLSPLPVDDLLREARLAGRVLVVDETRRSGGVSEGVFAELVDAGFAGPMRRVVARDSFIPLGPAANLVLVGEDEIETAAVELCRAGHGAGNS